MNTAQGVVRKIFSKAAGRGTVYDFQLVDDKTYYKLNFEAPKFEEGDEVRFNWEENKWGANVLVETIKMKKGNGPVASKSGGGKKGGGSRDDYWAEKDRYDKEVRQPVICYQSALNSAIDVVKIAQAMDALPINKNLKKADVMPTIMAVVREVRDEIFEDTMNLVRRAESGEALIPSEPADETAPAPEAQVPEAAPDAGFSDLDEDLDDDWS